MPNDIGPVHYAHIFRKQNEGYGILTYETLIVTETSKRRQTSQIPLLENITFGKDCEFVGQPPNIAENLGATKMYVGRYGEPHTETGFARISVLA